MAERNILRYIIHTIHFYLVGFFQSTIIYFSLIQSNFYHWWNIYKESFIWRLAVSAMSPYLVTNSKMYMCMNAVAICIQIVFKEYQYALPEDKSSIVFPIFHDIVKLLMMCGSGKSKDILSTYYIKFRHSKIFLSYYW